MSKFSYSVHTRIPETHTRTINYWITGVEYIFKAAQGLPLQWPWHGTPGSHSLLWFHAYIDTPEEFMGKKKRICKKKQSKWISFIIIKAFDFHKKKVTGKVKEKVEAFGPNPFVSGGGAGAGKRWVSLLKFHFIEIWDFPLYFAMYNLLQLNYTCVRSVFNHLVV